MTKQQIAENFSHGEFEKVYARLADNITWNVPGEKLLDGKEAVIANCKKVAAYFKQVTTNFKTANIVSEKNRVVIDGTAEFIRGGKRVAFVSACDVYEFGDDELLHKITSYCITEK